MSRSRALALSGLSLLLATSAAACSKKSTPAATGDNGTVATTPAGAGNAADTITIKGFGYNALTVAPGAKVTVLNMDHAEHTVTADKGADFSADALQNKPATFSAPTKAGTYKYHCDFHPSMHGTLVVK